MVDRGVDRTADREVDGEKAKPLRCFIAVKVGEEIEEALRRVIEELENTHPPRGTRVTWSRPQSWHVTLKFLGDVAADRVAEIGEALAAAVAGVHATEVEAGGLIRLPAHGRPRVVAAEVRDDGALGRLAERVENGMATLGFEREKRPFLAHLTIGRVRDRKGAEGDRPESAQPLVEVVESMRERSLGSGTVESVGLYKSELGRSGATYTRLVRVGLESGRLRGGTETNEAGEKPGLGWSP